MSISLKDRVFGAGHRVYTVLGVVAGVLVAAAQYLDYIPEEWRGNKFYVIATGLVAAGAWWKAKVEPTATSTVLPPSK